MEEFPKTQSRESERGESISEGDIESLKAFAAGYQAILSSVTKVRVGDIESGSLDPQLMLLLNAAQSFKETQLEAQERLRLDAHGLLSQVFRNEEQQALLEDSSQYRLEQMSEGLYAVIVQPKLSRWLKPGAYAAAARVKGGVSFLYIQEFSNPEVQENNLKENIPHETHHLIWDRAKEQGSFESSESDSDYRRSFDMFKDELLARVISGGGLSGYHHINHLSPEQRAALEQESPGKADSIIQKVVALNTFLGELDYLLHRSEIITKADLTKPIVEATSFADLEKSLKDIKLLIESSPLKPEENNDVTWG
jgi:hypothetical protein